MTKTVLIAGKFQNGAGLSGYVAEIGAAFLSADLGITPDIRDDHASYVASWLRHGRAAAARQQQDSGGVRVKMTEERKGG